MSFFISTFLDYTETESEGILCMVNGPLVIKGMDYLIFLWDKCSLVSCLHVSKTWQIAFSLPWKELRLVCLILRDFEVFCSKTIFSFFKRKIIFGEGKWCFCGIGDRLERNIFWDIKIY